MLKLLYRNNRLSAVGFSFCASASAAGASRRIHIPSSPHQRREPRPPPWLWQGAGGTRGGGFLPPQKASFQPGWGVQRAASGHGLCGCRSRGWADTSVSCRGWGLGGLLVPEGRALHQCWSGWGAQQISPGALLWLHQVLHPALFSAIKPHVSLKVNYAFVMMQSQFSPLIY